MASGLCMKPLIFLTLLQPSLAAWCQPETKVYCKDTNKQLSDLSCGWCRSWTFASNIAGNKLRMVGLDGGALPGDGNATRDYLVEASLDHAFDLTDGENWKLSPLPSSYPKLKGSTLWSNPSNSTLFSYGGHSLEQIRNINIGGIMALDISSNRWNMPPPRTTTPRMTGGASVSAPNLGKAFYIGGFQPQYVNHVNRGRRGSTERMNNHANSMVQFDTRTRAINLINAPFLPVQFGAASYIPTGSGALIYFGGETPPSQITKNYTDYNVNSWDFVWVYDIKGNKWYRQPTTGIVAPRSQFCTSTIFDEDSQSWQIWAIGGSDFESGNVGNTVSVLSIPSFQWFSAGPSETRSATSCERVGSQIFVIGGMQAIEEPDPLFNTGGNDYPAIAFVYDINKQAPVSSFVPTSTSYAAPSSIRAAVLTASTPATWGDPAIEELFLSSNNDR